MNYLFPTNDDAGDWTPPVRQMHPNGHASPFTLRGYQAEDCDGVEAAWSAGKRAVCVCWATGLGKSLLFAELSRRVKRQGRVLVVVDTTKLANDLYKTIIQHHGSVHDIGVLTGDLKAHWRTSRVVVATIQSLYAGRRGDETYRMLDPREFSAALVDECESSLADRFGATMLYFMDGNPDLRIAGASATPFRGDGRTMGELFDHAADAGVIGTLNRNLMWGVMNGWLVKPRQAFVHCDVDFGSIKIRKQKDGDRDWSDADITKVLMNQDEQEWRRMAEAIVEVANGSPAIVVCPNNVEIAKAIAGHLCGAAGDDHVAQAIYGGQGQYGRDLLDAHCRKEFQFAVSVRMLEKGYDNQYVTHAFMLRKTRSRRLYEQILGRVVRPLASIRNGLQAALTPEERMRIIAESAKPRSTMVDLVGVHPDAKDMGVIDIIGAHLPDELRRRTMELMHASAMEDDPDALDPPPEYDVGETAREANHQLAEERKREEERERRKRSLIQLGERHVTVEYQDDMTTQGGRDHAGAGTIARGSSTGKQAKLLIALGCDPSRALAASKRQAGAIISSMKESGADVDWRRVNRFERENGSID